MPPPPPPPLLDVDEELAPLLPLLPPFPPLDACEPLDEWLLPELPLLPDELALLPEELALLPDEPPSSVPPLLELLPGGTLPEEEPPEEEPPDEEDELVGSEGGGPSLVLPLDVPPLDEDDVVSEGGGPSLVEPVLGVSEAGGGQRGSVLSTGQSNSVPSTMGPSDVRPCVVVHEATCPIGTSSAPQVHVGAACAQA